MSECPRWRLIEPHYIKVPVLPDGTRVEWEHKETNKQSGRAVRKLFPVPMLLDPRDGADHNYPELGDIIVCRKIEGALHHRRDIIFEGDPTPGMEPLNDEAQAITDSLRAKWEHPIETLPANGGMNEAEMAFMQKMYDSFARVAAPQPTQVVPKEQYDELLKRVLALETANKPAEPTTTRRA